MPDLPPRPSSFNAETLLQRWQTRLKRWRPVGTDWALGLPVLACAAWLAGYEGLAMAFALGLPVILLLTGRGLRRRPVWDSSISRLTKAQAQDMADAILEECQLRGRGTIAFIAQLERPALGGSDWDGPAGEDAIQTICTRVAASLREVDCAFTMGDERIVALLSPIMRTDLDIAISIADRLQAAISEPLALQGKTVRVNSRIGFCTGATAVKPTGQALISGATIALAEAMRHEVGAVRAFTPEMHQRAETGHRLTQQVEGAIRNGEIRAWFQPQIEAKSGRLCGFEALARWHHPTLGILPPDQFLPAITASGNDAALGERMLRDALEALKAWDKAGLDVPQVGLNFSMQELRDPRLSDRIIWEIDRAEIAAERIAVEILETVTTEDAEETVLHNVRTMKTAGMRMDLDDFGTGAAAIRNIAHFGVHRIKIDRSFIRDLDSSDERRRMLTAIVSMAKELDIETLVEGVETEDQIKQLTGFGCDYLQGYAIARPMPFDHTIAWAHKRQSGRRDLGKLRPQGSA